MGVCGCVCRARVRACVYQPRLHLYLVKQLYLIHFNYDFIISYTFIFNYTSC